MAFHTVIEGNWEPSFLNGALSIVDGRNIERTDEKKIVISEEVAKKNNFGVGDMITARKFDWMPIEFYGNEMQFEIVGIFQIHFKQSYSELTFEDMMIENIVFTDRAMREWSNEENHIRHNEGIHGYRVGKAAEEIDNVSIFVDDPSLLNSIRERIFAMEGVDWQYYEINIDDTDYRVAAKPLLTIKNLFTVFLIALFAGTLAVLVLVLSLWMCSRSKEIGILTSIGVKRKGILFQFLFECCLITVVAFLLAGVAYYPVTYVVADITAEVFAPPKEQEGYKMVNDMSTGTFEIHREISEPIDFEYGISTGTVVFIFLILLLTVIVSVLRASARMVCQKPTALLRF